MHAASASTVTSGARPAQALRAVLHELMSRQPALAVFGFLLWALLLPTAVAWGLDERTLRDANVWAKPAKFLLALGAFSLTTAWLVGWIDVARRRSRSVTVAVATLIAASTLELAYIVVQAARGQASHYNVGDPLHQALYAAMAVGALLLTASGLPIAREIHRNGLSTVPVVLRQAAVHGLVLTFVLGAGVGMLLGGLQPPSGPGVATVPLFGWALAGDLRIAHFLGIHAQQLLPLAGAVLAARGRRVGDRALWTATVPQQPGLRALRWISGAYAALVVATLAAALATRAA